MTLYYLIINLLRNLDFSDLISCAMRCLLLIIRPFANSPRRRAQFIKTRCSHSGHTPLSFLTSIADPVTITLVVFAQLLSHGHIFSHSERTRFCRTTMSCQFSQEYVQRRLFILLDSTIRIARMYFSQKQQRLQITSRDKYNNFRNLDF